MGEWRERRISSTQKPATQGSEVGQANMKVGFNILLPWLPILSTHNH
jgi:hypothetical protein